MAGSRAQTRDAALLDQSLLFTPGVLPSVSIISPAFNEEASIVESVSALLDLRYPDAEVIVVSDGSRDRTVQRLVEHFGLERTEVFIHRYLETQPVRAVWASRRIPDLLVIDKENGGKADALNVGINAARKEYFAGIDADSLLERDALLSLAGQFLFSDEEVVAAGGNIMPVNGCTVRRGDLARDPDPPRRARPVPEPSSTCARSWPAGSAGRRSGRCSSSRGPSACSTDAGWWTPTGTSRAAGTT